MLTCVYSWGLDGLDPVPGTSMLDHSSPIMMSGSCPPSTPHILHAQWIISEGNLTKDAKHRELTIITTRLGTIPEI